MRLVTGSRTRIGLGHGTPLGPLGSFPHKGRAKTVTIHTAGRMYRQMRHVHTDNEKVHKK